MSQGSNSFPRILSLLRKEKGMSQKTAATDLGISQALLSHYEKGIRRPNLDFLVLCADYYDISCDYLLGRSTDRQGATIAVEEIPDPEDAAKGNVGVGGLLSELNKKLIFNSLNILFDLLTKIKSKALTTEISSYLMLAVYKMFRIVYKSNKKNEQAMFAVPEHINISYSDASMNIAEANADAIVSGKPIHSADKLKVGSAPVINTQTITEDYPLFASSLFNLIGASEKRIDYKQKPKK